MSCPSWCSRVHDDGEHVSAPEFVAPSNDAALVTAYVLGLDGAGEGGGRQLLVSLGVQQFELPDKPTVELLPSEARRLAAALVALAEQAEQAEQAEAGVTVVDLRAVQRARRPPAQQAT